ncbi:hypothetical protein [Flavisolibacter nicotianae]|uniref:hypothetical protein n=1 Tax=Flavisolibacter nicotianae TaxID=2364882 RepID=UPI0013C413F1|nr:hypothetical protein [Flavisolibacter nicotianae]
MSRPFLLLFFFPLSLAVMAQGDTQTDCYETFFATAAKVKNTKTVKLVVNKKIQTLFAYLKQTISGLEQRVALKDLDGDGRAELVIYNFTGGAHCCDEFYFFKNISGSVFAPAARLYAGSTCVSGTTFLYDFAEPFGYFYTCFACELDEKKNSKGEKYERIANISLTYKAGKLLVSPGDAALKEKLLRNLRYIKSLGWDGGAKNDEFDDGRRKALAQTLAVYYFSFGKNLPETKKIFDAYYPYKDAATVWKDFGVLLTNVQSQNSF